MALASSILNGREEVGRFCRHHPSRTEMIITFCVDKKIMIATMSGRQAAERGSKMGEKMV